MPVRPAAALLAACMSFAVGCGGSAAPPADKPAPASAPGKSAAPAPAPTAPAAPDPLALFFAAPADPGAKLPADGIYPQGRVMAYMGYSGKAERDLANGFTVAGPVYGDQAPYVRACIARGQPVVAQVHGMNGNFVKPSQTPAFTPADTEARVKAEVAKWAAHPEVIWWAVGPEELRPWRKDEMDYLALVCKTIRANDPLKRPVFMYNPNHRDAKALTPIAAQVDILGKGAYVNSAGKKDERAWVRWSIEQETEAAKTADHPVMPLLMPELCADPDPSEDALIEPWVRHDVYLGLCSGAKGVLLWSLFPRAGVKRTWQKWYDAYARCGRELQGPQGLAQVFLFGEPRSDLKVDPQGAAAAAGVTLGGDAEPDTTSAAEAAKRTEAVPDFTVCERAYGAKRWLFVVNSTGAARAFTLSGWPAGARLADGFSGQAIAAGAEHRLELPAWGVACVVLSR